MIVPDRLAEAAARNLGITAAQELVASIEGVTDDVIDGQDQARIAVAMLILALHEPNTVADVLRLVETDWRDLLMGAGLAHDDWPDKAETTLDALLAADLGRLRSAQLIAHAKGVPLTDVIPLVIDSAAWTGGRLSDEAAKRVCGEGP